MRSRHSKQRYYDSGGIDHQDCRVFSLFLGRRYQPSLFISLNTYVKKVIARQYRSGVQSCSIYYISYSQP